MRKTSIKRHSPIARHTPLRTGSPINRRRRKKDAVEWLRVFGSVERVNFVAGLVCCACKYGRNCENHHIKNDGAGRKADARFIVPLDWVCHQEIHTIGRESFEKKYGISLEAEAAKTERLWREHVAAPHPDQTSAPR